MELMTFALAIHLKKSFNAKDSQIFKARLRVYAIAALHFLIMYFSLRELSPKKVVTTK